MWNLLLSFFVGGAIGASRLGQRFVRPAVKLLGTGIVIAGLIYTYVVLNAIRERSLGRHGHTHSTR